MICDQRTRSRHLINHHSASHGQGPVTRNGPAMIEPTEATNAPAHAAVAIARKLYRLINEHADSKDNLFDQY